MVGFTKIDSVKLPYDTRELWLSDNRLFVGSLELFRNGVVTVFDISQNGDLTKLSSVKILEGPNDLWSNGDRLYVAGFNELSAFEVGSSGKLSKLSSPHGSSSAVLAQGKHLFVGDSFGLTVYKTGSGANVSQVQHVKLPQQVDEIVSDGKHLFVSAGGITSYSITADGSLVRASKLKIDGEIWTDGKQLVVGASGDNGIIIYDIAANGSLKRAQQIKVTDEFGSVISGEAWLEGGRLFVASHEIVIFEKNDRGKFAKVGAVITEGTPWEVWSEGDLLFVADYEKGVATYRLDSGGPNFLGSAGNDPFMQGTSAHDFMKGMGGHDGIEGLAGNDRIYGGSGNDSLYGGKGSDILYGGSGDDSLYGDGKDGSETDKKTNKLYGEAGNDKLYGGGGNDKLLGGTGNDDLRGMDGDDHLDGGSGNDKLHGESGNDRLLGGAGNDRLDGGYGDDKLIGGTGADKLYGGAGADLFVFTSTKDSTPSARDMVYDFWQDEGDRIQLSGIDARSATSKNDAFTFIGEKAFSEKAGELRYFHKSGDTFVYGDVDGDGKADFALRLDKTIDLVKGDFIL
ncbi:hypothetical protein GB928_004145 [Shinella curvata]|uniref:Peptidase M10 serralysin C-terminal domain-containing protein n=1 Tax=Shinella curvata TaxID=1817964 RepID=A0ABT8XAS8_9HYPH|nr:hypothetical protein [Shinella curvata]MCJ8051687.1 hypothetical protein [Shinella curvata]MDO6120366.1 hypothetical protein [Shinella curvata]